jgi:hypothetical protein
MTMMHLKKLFLAVCLMVPLFISANGINVPGTVTITPYLGGYLGANGALSVARNTAVTTGKIMGLISGYDADPRAYNPNIIFIAIDSETGVQWSCTLYQSTANSQLYAFAERVILAANDSARLNIRSINGTCTNVGYTNGSQFVNQY